jgi:hypothetical protein
MDSKGTGKKRSWICRGTVPAFTWRDGRKLRKSVIKIADVSAEFELQVSYLPSTIRSNIRMFMSRTKMLSYHVEP